MIIAFSFDDGRDDAYDAFQILKKYGLTGSFHVVTGFIDGSFITDAFGIGRKSLTPDQLFEMSQNGMDISSHGDRHIMEYNDFQTSFRKISKICAKESCVGFSVPNSDYSKDELLSFVSKNGSSLSYIRVGRSKKCYSLRMKINYALYHIFHFQSAFNLFNKNNILTNVEKFEMNSLVVLSDTRSKNLIKFIERNKNTDATLILMFHSIVDSPTNKWEYSKDEFIKVCSYVSNNCVVKTLKEIVSEKY